MTFHSRISPYAATYIRERATDLLDDECRITRPREAVLDENNDYYHPEGEVVYEGPCRLWETSAAMAVQVGDENIGVSTTYLSLPWNISPIPEMEDLVEMITSVDPDNIGRTFTLGKPAVGGNLRGTRRYAVKGESSTKDEW